MATLLNLAGSFPIFSHISNRPSNTPINTTDDTVFEEIKATREQKSRNFISHSATAENDPPSAVGSTYELIEQILLRLPIERIFLLQRVNKDWKGVIQRSHALKKKIGVMPRKTPITPDPCLTGTDGLPIHYFDSTLTLSPLLKLFPGLLPPTSPPTEDPRLGIIASFTGLHSGCDSNRASQLIDSVRLHFAENIPKDESWLGTFVTNPPIPTMKLRIDYSRQTKVSSVSRIFSHGDVVRRAEGLRFRDVLRGHRDLVRRLTEDEGFPVVPEFIYAEIEIVRAVSSCEAKLEIGHSHAFPWKLWQFVVGSWCDWLEKMKGKED